MKKSKNNGDFYITCPCCDDIVYITKVKCGLFLHAYNMKNKKAVNPHSKRSHIEKIRKSGNLVGCGMKFKIKINKNGTMFSTPIGY